MAKLVFLNGYVQIAGTDLSDHASDITLELVKEQVDVTAMGADAHQWLGGLENDKLTVTFWQDFAASEVDATLYPIWAAGTAVAFKVAANTSSISSTNPSYSGSVILSDYQPIAGKVGTGLSSAVTFMVSGTVTRGTV
jgi:hypothetical protein